MKYIIIIILLFIMNHITLTCITFYIIKILYIYILKNKISPVRRLTVDFR